MDDRISVLRQHKSGGQNIWEILEIDYFSLEEMTHILAQIVSEQCGRVAQQVRRLRAVLEGVGSISAGSTKY